MRGRASLLKIITQKIKICQDQYYIVFYHILIFSIFLEQAVLSFQIPGIGSIYLFRVMLVIMIALTVYRIIKGKEKPDFSGSLKYLVIFFVVVAVHGMISIAFAGDRINTISLLLNWILDGFFLVIIICFNNNKKRIKHTFIAILWNTSLLLTFGIVETFVGSIFFPGFGIGQERITFFNAGLHQIPYIYTLNPNGAVTLIVFSVLLSLAYLLSNTAKSDSYKKKTLYSAILSFFLVGGFYIAVYAISTLGQIALLALGIFTILCYFFLFQGKGKKLPIFIVIIGYFFVILASNYPVVQAKTINTFNHFKAMMYEIIPRKNDTTIDHQPEKTPSIPIPSLIESQPENSPSIPIPSLYPNSFIIDTKSFNEDSYGSGVIRLKMIQFGINTFIRSYGLGVGMGNTEFYARTSDFIVNIKEGAVSALHCFPVRIVSDCGVFALVPLSLFILSLLRDWYRCYSKFFFKSRYHKTLVLTSGLAIIISPLAVILPSDAQDVWLMWLFYTIIAIILDPKKRVDEKLTEEPV